MNTLTQARAHTLTENNNNFIDWLATIAFTEFVALTAQVAFHAIGSEIVGNVKQHQ